MNPFDNARWQGDAPQRAAFSVFEVVRSLQKMNHGEILRFQEVDELTSLLGTDEGWEPQRRLLEAQGLELNSTLLAGWYEGAEDEEYGCFATGSGTVIESEGRSDASPRKKPIVWEDRTGDSSIAASFDAAPVGRRMALGEIPNRWVKQD